jgi:hypothetical protein
LSTNTGELTITTFATQNLLILAQNGLVGKKSMPLFSIPSPVGEGWGEGNGAINPIIASEAICWGMVERDCHMCLRQIRNDEE